MEAEGPGSELPQLRRIASRHGVRYEVLPEMDLVDHQLVKVGFRLDLWGLHLHPKGVAPGCPECRAVYDELEKIAEWILPGDERPSRYEIEPFDRALHAAPGLKDRDEVLVEVKILHRHDAFAPIDACEERCLKEMKERLALLDVIEGPRRPGARPAREG